MVNLHRDMRAAVPPTHPMASRGWYTAVSRRCRPAGGDRQHGVGGVGCVQNSTVPVQLLVGVQLQHGVRRVRGGREEGGVWIAQVMTGTDREDKGSNTGGDTEDDASAPLSSWNCNAWVASCRRHDYGPERAEHTVPGKGKLCMVAASSVNQVGEACSYGGSGYRLRVSAVSARWSSRRLLQSGPATDCHGERCGCLWSFCTAPASGQGEPCSRAQG